MATCEGVLGTLDPGPRLRALASRTWTSTASIWQASTWCRQEAQPTETKPSDVETLQATAGRVLQTELPCIPEDHYTRSQSEEKQTLEEELPTKRKVPGSSERTFQTITPNVPDIFQSFATTAKGGEFSRGSCTALSTSADQQKGLDSFARGLATHGSTTSRRARLARARWT